MDPSISKDAVRKVLASEHSVKRCKAEVGSPQTPKEPEREASSTGKKRTEAAADHHGEGKPLFSKPWDDLGLIVEQIGLAAILENPAVASEQFELFCSSAKKKLSDEWTSFQLSLAESTFLEHYESMKICHFRLTACLYELNKRRLASEDDFKKSKANFEATISNMNETISNLKADLTLNSNKLAEVEAKLKESESSQVHLNSRVKSLEAQLEMKNVLNEFLKEEAVISERKASNSERKALSLVNTIVELDKYSKKLSSAAAKAIEDFNNSKKV